LNTIVFNIEKSLYGLLLLNDTLHNGYTFSSPIVQLRRLDIFKILHGDCVER